MNSLFISVSTFNSCTRDGIKNEGEINFQVENDKNCDSTLALSNWGTWWILKISTNKIDKDCRLNFLKTDNIIKTKERTVGIKKWISNRKNSLFWNN